MKFSTKTAELKNAENVGVLNLMCDKNDGKYPLEEEGKHLWPRLVQNPVEGK